MPNYKYNHSKVTDESFGGAYLLRKEQTERTNKIKEDNLTERRNEIHNQILV
jgi:hypothetical protein